MSSFPRSVVAGPLLGGSVECLGRGLSLDAVLCDLRPALLPKGTVGRHHRAVARNGRVLVASTLPPGELAGRAARLRLSYWHRRILPDDPPEPYGLLACVRPLGAEAAYQGVLAGAAVPDALLSIDLGGGRVLSFTRRQEADPGQGSFSPLPSGEI
jgi:hypothetical protein